MVKTVAVISTRQLRKPCHRLNARPHLTRPNPHHVLNRSPPKIPETSLGQSSRYRLLRRALVGLTRLLGSFTPSAKHLAANVNFFVSRGS